MLIGLRTHDTPCRQNYYGIPLLYGVHQDRVVLTRKSDLKFSLLTWWKGVQGQLRIDGPARYTTGKSRALRMGRNRYSSNTLSALFRRVYSWSVSPHSAAKLGQLHRSVALSKMHSALFISLFCLFTAVPIRANSKPSFDATVIRLQPISHLARTDVIWRRLFRIVRARAQFKWHGWHLARPAASSAASKKRKREIERD